MLPEIQLEALAFLDRAALEACQLVNRGFRSIIDRTSMSLALRPIDYLLIVSSMRMLG